MKLKKLEKPIAVEELTFQITPEMIDQWIEKENEIWTTALEKCEGFLGKEYWINDDVPGEVTIIMYWTDASCFINLPKEWHVEIDKQMEKAFPDEHVKFVRAGHVGNQKYITFEAK